MSEPLHGLMAEFETPEQLLHAARAAKEAGYKDMEAYTPFSIDELADAVGMERNNVALVTFLGGLVGVFCGFFMQWYSCVISYPVNIGGRPHLSWPAWVPICFELTVLGAALSAGIIGVIVMNRLPKPYHPVFNVPSFARASQDRFFLCIEATDPRFKREATAEFLALQRAVGVYEVPV